jgi:hypothetical protein
VCRAICRQRLGKHVPAATDTHATIQILLETVFSTRSVQRGYKENNWSKFSSHPCGGGVEYLHRDPASRRRRRKVKSRIWDSKIWPRVLRDADPKITALARASCNCKRQTRPLVREGAPNKKNPQLSDNNKDLGVSPRRVLDSKTDWPADRRS